jgi:2-oxoisovalerate dehydrogenase E2 component (dihydrolipoyl transacylase)
VLTASVAHLQSDKSTVDITSRYDGVVRKLHYAVGAMAKTGTAMLDLEVRGGSCSWHCVKRGRAGGGG